ncbi:low-density lipoprotein receptor-related protein 11 [Alosa pseudoharengus]|uniref:low-density lipoprotein receptor-related protein 11 n=1 Tax=Alosa pseudoharengus TaxID=34774 RepID=UPI003F89FA47
MLLKTLHHRRLVLYVFLLFGVTQALTRSSQLGLSDLKSKISGVEELLEEFRKQLQQDQAYSRDDDAGDVCLNDFTEMEEHIIRARDSIEQGATFLSAPSRVYSWKDCLHACCLEPHCTVAVMQEDLKQSEESLGCYLFNCTYRNKNVCTFSMQQGFSTYSRVHNVTAHRPAAAPSNSDMSKQLSPRRRPLDDQAEDETSELDMDEPPRTDAGKDVMVQLPTDWAVLDGRDSVDDHGVAHYEWALVKGNPSVTIKVTHPGLLKITDLQVGVYVFQLTVTDTAGQRSSDNVSVTVLAPERHSEACIGSCSHYQFMCDDGCCIDISYACDGKQQCPDRSDEDFCHSFDGGRKTVNHAATPQQAQPADQSMIPTRPKATMEEARPSVGQIPTRSKPPPPAAPESHNPQNELIPEQCTSPPVVGPCKGIFPRWYYDPNAGECKHFIYGGCKGNHNNFLQDSDCINECIQRPAPAKPETTTAPAPNPHTEMAVFSKVAVSELQPENLPVSKSHRVLGGHPPPESGAILPLVLGILISALLLLMVGCRLRLVRHKLKKARPLTTEESDYLINGMYL